MELTSLRYFVAVAHELNFHRAAEKLHMTQSPLSLAIRKLEDELEVRLFERTSRSVRLTREGEAFLAEAEAVLSRADLALRRMAELAGTKNGRLAIGYNEPALNSILPKLLAQYREKHPAMRLELREEETAEQLALIRRGGLDIGIMRPFGFDLSGLESRPVFREEYRLVMPECHELAKRPVISRGDLAGHEIILFAREVNPAIYDRLADALSAGCSPTPKFRQDARNKNSMLALVQAGFGAAVVPGSCCGGALPGLATRKLDIPLPPVEIVAVWDPARLTGALASFIRLLPAAAKRR